MKNTLTIAKFVHAVLDYGDQPTQDNFNNVIATYTEASTLEQEPSSAINRVTFLSGIALGAAGTAGAFFIVSIFQDLYVRLGQVEGYIIGLDKFLRQLMGGAAA